MKRVVGLFSALTALSLLAAPAVAGISGFDVKLNGNPSGSLNGLGGGSFSVQLRADENPVPTNLRFGEYDGKSRTFCVEMVTFYPGKWYEVTIDGDNILNTGGTLTPETKNLFAHYVDGNLDAIGGRDWASARPIATDKPANRALQALFWDLQGVNSAPGDFESNYNWLANHDPTAADLYEGYWDYAAANANPGQSQVQVMNLWCGPDDYTGDAQSQLVRVVPAPGVMLLSSIGLGLVGWVKRRVS